MEIIEKTIKTSGFFPGNDLPLLIYKSVLSVTGTASEIAALFAENGWINSWENGIYDFHHFHSNTHEVLGIVSGQCRVQFGGPDGFIFLIEAGDVILIPAGVSHKNLSQSKDLSVVGAYPVAIDYDMKKGLPEELKAAQEMIQQVKLPRLDPVYGKAGPLFDYWK